MSTITEPPQSTPAAITDLACDLAAVTDRLVAGVCAADPHDVGMATAGAVLAATDRLTAAVVEVLARVSHRGVIADEGLSVGSWLRTFASRTVSDEKMLAAAAERLRDMPALRRWFRDGDVSWSVVRAVVLAVRNLTREQRRWVDATLAGDGRVRRLDAEDLVGAAQALADQARPDLHRDRERRAVEREFFRWEKAFDGSSRGSFAFGAEGTAAMEEAIAAMRDAANPDDTDTAADADSGSADADGDGGDGDDPDGAEADTNPDDRGDDRDRDGDTTADHGSSGDEPSGDEPSGGGDRDTGDSEPETEGIARDWYIHERTWTNAQALLALCRQRLGHHGGTAPSPARPSMLIIADLATLHSDDDGGDGVGSATAQLLQRCAGGTVELTPAAAQRLECDAQLRIILTDNDDILGASAAEPAVSATLRAALVARDGRCRFPGCHQPPQRCENHHVVKRSHGGKTELGNLALICAAHHHAIHDSHWANTLHPDGTMTFTRRGVTLTTHPRAARRVRPTTPPPSGRPTRPTRPTRRHRHSGSHGGGEEPRMTARPGEPPPDDDLPF